MHEYDTTLKSLLTRPGCGLLADLINCPAEQWTQVHWHNVELPQVRSLRVDLLGEISPHQLIHIELQRSNEPAMALRMAEYAFSIHRQFGLWPRQFVLYIGQEPLRMSGRLENHALTYACRMVDIREFDAEPSSPAPISKTTSSPSSLASATSAKPSTASSTKSRPASPNGAPWPSSS